MTVKYNVISYLVGEGFRNTLKNKKSTGAALIIMCMAMLMFGLFFILGENVNYIMNQVEAEQGMQVFLDIGTTETEIADIQSKIRQIKGVNTIKYISGKEGYNEAVEGLDEYSKLMEGLKEWYPDSFIVTLTDLELNKSVQDQINAIDKVDEITSSDSTINILLKITKGVRFVTLGILAILVIISIFIITNTIKLTVHARRKEISIMKYVGATNSFIRWPFIVEGIIIGIVAALITIFVVGLLYNIATNGIVQTETFQRLGLKLYTFRDMFNLLILTYILLGAGIGIIRKYDFNEKIPTSVTHKKIKEEEKMLKKITCVLLSILVVSISIVSFATSTTDLNNKKTEIDQKINEASGKIDDIKEEVDEVTSELLKLNHEIAEKEDEIEELTEELDKLNGEIEELEKQIAEEQKKYDEEYELFGKRMIAQYKQGKVYYLDVLLNSKSISDFISRQYIIEKVAEYDNKILSTIEKQKSELENNKKSLEEKQKALSDKESKLKLEKVTLSNRKINRDRYVAKLNDDQKKLQNEIEKLTEEKRQVENEIRRIAQQSGNGGGGYVYSGGRLVWPCPNYVRISSLFGYRGSAATGGVGSSNHKGIDMAAAKGVSILAAESGVVIKVSNTCTHNYAKTYSTRCSCGGGFGNYIMVSHGGGLVTLYAHCSTISVKVGDNVIAGQQIGTVGTTGYSTGPHLHFSVLLNGTYVDPAPYLGM